MATVTIQIGNSDDKLTQREWNDFCLMVEFHAKTYSTKMHFSGGSQFNAPWQNACWVCEVEESRIARLEDVLSGCRKDHKQDSIAVTIGKTKLI